MLTQLAVAFAISQSPALDGEAASQRMENYVRQERLAVATVDSLNCVNLGYEVPAGGGTTTAVLELWQRSFEPDGVELPAYMERYNAQVRRLRTEFEEEARHAETSREAFRIFKRNLNKRCDALAFDRPDWLQRNSLTLVTSVMNWRDAEISVFGSVDPAE